MLDMRLRLPELMKRRGLTVTGYALAKYSKGQMTYSLANRLLGQPKRIDFTTLDLICVVLGADPTELFERDEQPPPKPKASKRR